MISPYGKPQTTIIFFAALALAIGCAALGWWWALGGVALVTVVLLAFFRDPRRAIPTLKNQVVAAADGRISSIHTVEHYPPFDGPAVCVRTFLSVLDVHVNRAPLHGQVKSIRHRPGKYLNALKAESAELNESVTMLLVHPAHGHAVAAVRQVAGAIARRIVNGAHEGQILQRGQRFGLIKFGSTTEVYLPYPDRVQVHVRQGQYTWGGNTVLATAAPIEVARRDVKGAAETDDAATEDHNDGDAPGGEPEIRTGSRAGTATPR